MENKKLKKWENRLLFGAIAGGILLLYRTLLLIAGTNFNSITSFLNFAFVASLMILSMVKGTNKYRDDYFDGYISYKTSFTHGFFINLITGVLANIPEWVYTSFFGGKKVLLETAYNTMYEIYGSNFTDLYFPFFEKMYQPIPMLFFTII
ncbi:MAG: DUF4199 domain-containing protein, partial [Bacteroidales bacterium]|nr:DUF4199 domain-containing protein [Bacteroidales bacterium]